MPGTLCCCAARSMEPDDGGVTSCVDCGAVDVRGPVVEPAEDIEREAELTMAVVESVRVRESDAGDSVPECAREAEEAEVEGALRYGVVVEAVLELDTGESKETIQRAL